MAYDMSKLGPAILVRFQSGIATATAVNITSSNTVVDAQGKTLVVSPTMIFATLDDATASTTETLNSRIADAQEYIDIGIPTLVAHLQTSIKNMQQVLSTLPLK